MKEKLDIKEQIQNLKSKGITFDIVNEETAECVLSYSTYLFKIKSYARNFDASNGRYLGLDFAHLFELSKIDMYFRRALFNILIDVEHCLKTNLLKDFSTLDKITAKMLTADFLKSKLGKKTKNFLERPIKERPIKDRSVSKLLIESNSPPEQMPFWVLVEIMQLGNLLELYEYFYQKRFKNFYKLNDIVLISNAMFSLKCLRNAVAHNNCILTNVFDQSKEDIQQELYKILSPDRYKIQPKTGDTIEKMLANQTISDFLMAILLAKLTIKSDGMLNSIKRELSVFFKKTCATKHRLKIFAKHRKITSRTAMVYKSCSRILSTD